MKNIKNVSINELFTYDLVSQPSFVNATINYTTRETREEKRKIKIKQILKNPLIWVGFFIVS